MFALRGTRKYSNKTCHHSYKTKGSGCTSSTNQPNDEETVGHVPDSLANVLYEAFELGYIRVLLGYISGN